MRPDMNLVIKIYRETEGTPDAYGGATETFAEIGQYRGRLEMSAPSKMLLEQGVEVTRMATVLLRVHQAATQTDKALIEGDTLEIISPAQHPYYGKRWSILSVQYPAIHPNQRRNLVRCQVERADESRTEADIGL